MITLKDLADAILSYDTDQTCQFCEKNEWGEDNHYADCPFSKAYKARDQIFASNAVTDQCKDDLTTLRILAQNAGKYYGKTGGGACMNRLERWLAEHRA